MKLPPEIELLHFEDWEVIHHLEPDPYRGWGVINGPTPEIGQVCWLLGSFGCRPFLLSTAQPRTSPGGSPLAEGWLGTVNDESLYVLGRATVVGVHGRNVDAMPLS